MDVAERYPRVSLVLIAFRQERFIREAVRSALEQDYPNLQIILSDDCSPENTFSIMEEAAGAYCGPHEVVVRQPPRNLGLVRHVFDAAALATGELFVMAAGDDVSFPGRVRRLTEEWQASGAMALFSNWNEIDEAGRTIRHGRPPGRSDLLLDRYFPGWPTRQIVGATSAYAREVFTNVPLPNEPIFAEDLYFSLMLGAWRRPIAYVADPLVGYRTHDAALTHNDRAAQSIADDELRVERESAHVAEVLDLFERVATSTENEWGAIGPVDWATVRQDADFNRFRSGWIEAGVAVRLHALQRFTAPLQRRWLLPRLFGLRTLSAMKRLRGRH